MLQLLQAVYYLIFLTLQVETDDAKVELFCKFDTPNTHADVSSVLSESAFSGLDRLVQVCDG